MTTPRLIMGTMTIGGGTNQQDATTMVFDFCNDAKWRELVKEDPMLDTAIMYQGGTTEKILGDIIEKNKDKLPSTLSIASKANPFTKDKNLSPSGIRQQLESSLESLQVESIDIFYLHAPDPNYAIEPSLGEIQKLYSEKKFKKFGLSNFTAWETVYIHSYMSSRNYVVPTIYQGMYNAITRQVETELIPALRKLGMSFYAYNPLAGGMLSGKYQPSENDKEAAKRNSSVGDRFAGNTIWAKRYRERYQQQEQFAALEIVRESLGDDISMAEASLRWMRHHSVLNGQDGIIVGASNTSHYDSNMKSLSEGPLSDEIVKAFNNAAQLCQDVCPNYSRGYSGSAITES